MMRKKIQKIVSYPDRHQIDGVWKRIAVLMENVNVRSHCCISHSLHRVTLENSIIYFSIVAFSLIKHYNTLELITKQHTRTHAHINKGYMVARVDITGIHLIKKICI